MKKFITVVTLSLTLLISSSALTGAASANNSIILHVNNSNYDQNCNLYISQVMDENGDVYIIQSYDDISNKWLDATITNDGEIIDYTFLK